MEMDHRELYMNRLCERYRRPGRSGNEEQDETKEKVNIALFRESEKSFCRSSMFTL